MIVFKYFLKIVFKNRKILLAYFLMFMVLSFSQNYGGDGGYQDLDIKLGLVVSGDGGENQEFINYLTRNYEIDFLEDDLNLVRENIYLASYDGIVRIKGDLLTEFDGKKAIDLYLNPNNPRAYTIKEDINNYLDFIKNQSYYEEVGYRIKDLEKEAIEVIKIQSPNKLMENMAGYYNFSAYIIMAVIVTVIGYVMTDFQEDGVETRNKISSITSLNFNLGLYLGQVFTGGIVVSTVIFLGYLFRARLGLTSDLTYFNINLLAYSFSIFCFSFLINNITREKFIKTVIGTAFSLGASFVSGVMVSQSILDPRVLNIAKAFPMYYFIRANNLIGSYNYEVLPYILVQALFGSFFLLLGLFIAREKTSL